MRRRMPVFRYFGKGGVWWLGVRGLAWMSIRVWWRRSSGVFVTGGRIR